MISVILPVYNQAEKLKKTLEALNRQSYRDFEVIIVNLITIALFIVINTCLKTRKHLCFNI